MKSSTNCDEIMRDQTSHIRVCETTVLQLPARMGWPSPARRPRRLVPPHPIDAGSLSASARAALTDARPAASLRPPCSAQRCPLPRSAPPAAHLVHASRTVCPWERGQASTAGRAGEARLGAELAGVEDRGRRGERAVGGGGGDEAEDNVATTSSWGRSGRRQANRSARTTTAAAKNPR